MVHDCITHKWDDNNDNGSENHCGCNDYELLVSACCAIVNGEQV